MILILMVMLFQITSKTAIGSKAVYKEDFVVITGSMSINADTTETKLIEYPEGLTSENCVPISCGVKIIENKGFNYVGYNVNSGSMLNNAYNRWLNLKSDKIQLMVTNPDTSNVKTVNYKIVLMKIS